MKKYRIYPSIGIARLGGSHRYFICPEQYDSLGTEIDGKGNEVPVTRFKDGSGLIKRQGARFRIYQLNEASNKYEPLVAGPGIAIEWAVHLVNKKAAVIRPNNNKRPPQEPSLLPLDVCDNAEELIIDGGKVAISGKNAVSAAIKGRYKQEEVYLGHARTDRDGNLIVLGGNGTSRSPSGRPVGPQPDPETGERDSSPNNSFYYNEDWYDDTSDGCINAIVKVDGQPDEEALGAWVIVAPPDYAPGIKGMVTLYDIIEEASGSAALPTSFTTHIRPLIENFKNHAWVHESDYIIEEPMDMLSDPGPASKAIRRTVAGKLKCIETYLEEYKITEIQHTHFNNYKDGNFTNDAVPGMYDDGHELTRAVLGTTLGQGFRPGFEAGILLRNPDIYEEPFRLDQAKVQPGEITALMALPWQADLLECQGKWWPTHRPDDITLPNGDKKPWARTKNGSMNVETDHHLMVQHFNKLGFIKPNGDKHTEDERDPSF